MAKQPVTRMQLDAYRFGQRRMESALARRDAWLARHAHEAVVVWDGQDPATGKLVRSLRDHLGEEDVWILSPAEVA